MFDFTRMHTVWGVWFVAYRQHDLMVMAWQETVLSAVVVRLRFRTYDPESTDPWDGKDPKSWYTIQPEAEPLGGDVVQGLQRVIAQIREQWHESTELVDEFVGPATATETIAWMQTRKWCHGRLLDPRDPDYARFTRQADGGIRQRRRRRR